MVRLSCESLLIFRTNGLKASVSDRPQALRLKGLAATRVLETLPFRKRFNLLDSYVHRGGNKLAQTNRLINGQTGICTRKNGVEIRDYKNMQEAATEH